MPFRGERLPARRRERERDRELYAGIITAGGGEDDKCGMGERIKRKERKKERHLSSSGPHWKESQAGIMKTQHSTGCHFALHLSPTVQTVRWRMVEIARSSVCERVCTCARAKESRERERVKAALVLYGSLSVQRARWICVRRYETATPAMIPLASVINVCRSLFHGNAPPPRVHAVIDHWIMEKNLQFFFFFFHASGTRSRRILASSNPSFWESWN